MAHFGLLLHGDVHLKQKPTSNQWAAEQLKAVGIQFGVLISAVAGTCSSGDLCHALPGDELLL